MSKYLTGTLGVLLVVSAGANLWLLTTPLPADSAGSTSRRAKTARDGAGSHGSQSDPDSSALATCRRELQICQRQRKLGPLAFGSFRGRRPADDERPSATDTDVSDAERSYLCDFAQEQAQQGWLERKDEIVWALRASLGDADVQEKDMKSAVDRYAEGLDLDDADRERFESQYRDVRLDRIENVRAAIDQDPPDFPEILEQVKALHADEDRLTTELFGDEATIWLRENELEARSAIRAIAATYADVPWEDAIDVP